MIALRGQTPYQTEKGSVPVYGAVFKRWAWGILPASALVISSSRSFALGIGAAVIIWLVLLVSSSRGAERRGISTSLNQLRDSSPYEVSSLPKGAKQQSGPGMTAGKIAIFAIAGVIIFFIAIKLPLPAPRSQRSFEDMLLSKNVSQRDAAVASRWSLIKVLDAKIMEAPLLGSGFGATVTYMSSDPRIISTTGGTYTTSAFEWNYHDILVKMGILGLLAYGYLLFAIFLALWRSDKRERNWLVPSFFALIVLNAVSPFLNHPLGIGYLALLLALAERKRGEPAPVMAAEPVRSPAPALAAAPGLAMLSEE
jgi:O-antigen ligase